MKQTNKQTLNLRLLLFALAVPFAAGAIGSIFTSEAIPAWYAGLEKPTFNPPNWMFGPVWTLLYALQGIAFYLILKAKKDSDRATAIKLFAVQIVANTLWSIIFFGIKAPELAIIDISILWALIILTIRAFSKINKVAAKLLWPYLAWVSFAAILNTSIALLN